MPVAAGSLWVEGTFLNFCPTTTTRFRYLGTFVANRAAGVAGSIWIDGADLRYLDSNKDERVLPLGATSTPAGVASAVNGSIWIEGNLICSVEGVTKQKREYHTDQPFSNSHTDTHSDVFSNVPYTNSHGDQAFTNFFNFPNHTDNFFVNSHIDDAHTDFHQDDPFFNSHTDVAHQDQPEYVGTV